MQRLFGVIALLMLMGVIRTQPILAGDLNPPAGPVAPSMKPLSEVEPRTAISAVNTPGDGDSTFRIAASGSYYLTGNVSGEASKAGIEIAASNVSVDLMGFELQGVSGSLQGIRVTAANTVNISIRNGAVRGWGGAGVDTNSATSKVLSQIRVSNCGASGFAAGASAVITECVSTANTGAGFTLGIGGVLSNCLAANNMTFGISANIGNTLSNCTALFNLTDGISIGQGSTVTACTSRGNSGNGIVGGAACMVQQCTSSANLGDGILVSVDARVMNNSCDGQSGGAGIHATSDDNRIDSNHVSDNLRGIDVDAGGNLIIRNSAANNTTDYDIVAGNSKAEVLTPGDDFVATNPWANFSF